VDPLSELLSLLKPRSTISSGFEAGGDWSIQSGDQHQQIKCYVILSGGCWLAVEGIAEAVRLEEGDGFVLPSGRPFRLASDLAVPSVDAAAIFPAARSGGVVTVNGGGDFSLAGSRFAVSGNHADMLVGLSPPIVHIREEGDQTALRWSIDRMMEELRSARPGGALVAQHLAHMILVQALRVHLAECFGRGHGWFYALADEHLSRAIAAIHADPARDWTLRELGQRAGMSRSTFALRFRQVVGETPMDYLARWRMMLACDQLENGDHSISRMAPALGYRSESAFSTAFKRVIGCSPREYSSRIGTRNQAERSEAPAFSGHAVSVSQAI
jgi:AraC-like DNA-binding protein